MTRRKFLVGSGAFAACALEKHGLGAATGHSSEAPPVRLDVDTERTLGVIPTDFIGLGYEISSVARDGLLSGRNEAYVQLVRTLGPHGVIRIGGNTSDYSAFASNGPAVSAPKSTVINEANLKELGSFLEATGWKLIWGLNLGRGTEKEAAEEALAVASAAKSNLLAFEIGNEPDLFGRGAGHRPGGYSYEEWLNEYRRYKSAIRAKLVDAPFGGPDAATATDWVTRFATDEGKELKLLTHHYYRECAKPTSNLDKLLHPDPKLAPMLEKLRAASESSRLPYRICETNSFCGGGKPGVSDTFGSALWVLDYMHALASANAAGVNMETGVNQLGFISSYSPIGDDEHGTYSAKPEYYGMLAFSQASQGQRVGVSYDAQALNLTAYGVLGDRGRISVTIINKDAALDADVSIGAKSNFVGASTLRLTAPSLDAREGVTLGGAPVGSDRRWKPQLIEALRSKGGTCSIRVPAGSAALVYLET